MLPSPRMDDPLLLLRVPRDVLHAMGFLVVAHLVPTGILHLRGLRPSFYRRGLSIPASIADSAVNPLVRLLKRANLAPAASGTGVLTVSAQHQPLLPTNRQVVVRSPRQRRRTNGGGTPNRWMRSRIAANKSRGTTHNHHAHHQPNPLGNTTDRDGRGMAELYRCWRVAVPPPAPGSPTASRQSPILNFRP